MNVRSFSRCSSYSVCTSPAHTNVHPVRTAKLFLVLKAQVGWPGLVSERKNNNLVITSLKNLGPGSSPSTDNLEWPQNCHLMQPYNESKISFSVPFLCPVCWDSFWTVDKRYPPSVANYRDWERASLEQDDTKALFKCQVKNNLKISANRLTPSSVHSPAIEWIHTGIFCHGHSWT